MHSEEPEAEGDDVADDDFLKNVVNDKTNRHSIGEPQPSSDDEDGCQAPKWVTAKRTAHFVHRASMKSREGVLHSFDVDEEDFDYEEEDNYGPSKLERAPGISRQA
jgi:hypothetical protein